MKSAKKALALIMVLCALCATGCQSSQDASSSTSSAASTSAESSAAEEEAKEPVTITWWYRGNGEQADTQLVNDKVNEMLKSYEGLEHVTLEMNCFASSDYSTQVTLGLSSNAQIDILNTVSLSLYELVGNGTLMPLDDYMDLVPELTEELPDWLIDYGRLDGSLYMIPHYQQVANGRSFAVPTEYVEKGYIDMEMAQELFSGATVMNHTSAERAEFLENYVKTVREQEGRSNVWCAYPDPMGTSNLSELVGYYDYLSGYNTNTGFYVSASDHKVGFFDTTEGAEEIFEQAARWYDEGLTFPDPTVDFHNTFKGKNMMSNEGNCFVYEFSNGTGDSEYLSEMSTAANGFDTTVIQLSDYYAPVAYAAGGDGICASSEHPEEALKVIECMNIERGKEIYNTVVYGIEGTHWEFVDEASDTINTFGYDGPQGGSDYLYSAHKWIMGNTFNAYLNQGCSAETLEIAREINESPTTIHSELTGITYDTTSLSTQMEQIAAILAEYQETLLNGSKGLDGWRAYYDEYLDKLEKAGLETVITEVQKQVDDFLAQ